MSVILTVDNTFVHVDGAGLKAIRAIDNKCSYKIAGYFFSPAYKSRRWDGKEHLFKFTKANGYHAPVGMLTDIVDVLNKKKIKYKVNFKTKLKYDKSSIEWNDEVQLRDYQNEAVTAMFSKPFPGRGVLKMPIRSGKTKTVAKIIQKIGRPSIFVVPSKWLLYQTMASLRECMPNIGVGQVGDSVFNPKFVTVATIQSLAKMAPIRGTKKRESRPAHPEYFDLMKRFDLGIFDECFVSGTDICGKPIESIRIGDYVSSFDKNLSLSLNRVTRVFKKKPKLLVRISFSNGKKIVCTDNHPILTSIGWKKAIDLDTSHMVYHTTYDGKNLLRNLQKRNRHIQLELEQKRSIQKNKKSILFNRMWKKIYGKDLFQKSTPSIEENKKSIFYSNEEKKPNERSKNKSKGFGKIKSHGPYATMGIRRKRKRNKCSGEIAIYSARLESGICDSNKETKRSRISNLLQGRYSKFRSQNSYRSRWYFSRNNKTTKIRQEENKTFEQIRVENIEIFKPGSDGKFGGLCKDGFVYNLEVENDNTYIANGIAVHNCHHIRGQGDWHRVFMDLEARFKIGISATVFFDNTKEQESGIIWLRGNCGPIKCDIPTSRLIKEGFLLPQHVKIYKVETPDLQGSRYSATLKKRCITENLYRNKMIASLVEEHLPMKTIIIANEHAHIGAICEELDSLGIDHRTLTGKDRQSKRDEIVREFVSGRFNVIVGNVLGEGVDIPEVECVINAEGGKDEKKTWQRQRNLTIVEGSEKIPIMIDFYDDTCSYFRRHSKARLKVYKSEEEFKTEILEWR